MGASQFSTLWFNDDQPNSIKNGAGTGNVQIENGGTLKFSVSGGNYYQNVSGGNFRFVNGSTIQGDYRNNGQSINPQGTATFALGDGNDATTDTVTFSTASYLILIDKAGYSWSQDGGVIVRYAVTANNSGFGWANYTDGGNGQMANLKVRNGAASTEFAPPAGMTNFLAGPASGNVMEITNQAKVITAGTVQFMNNTAAGTYATGPIAALTGGTLAFSTNGTVLASNVTFYAGSTQAVTVVGTASNAIGYLKVAGTLVYTNGAKLVGSNPSSFKPAQGFWYVAEATSISGLPSIKGFSGVAIEAGTPQRLKVFPDVKGTVFTFR